MTGLVTPAFAQLWVTLGPYPTFDACFIDFTDFYGVYDTQRCAYQDLAGTANDGWYFKVAPMF